MSTSSLAESTALQYSDMETVRRRLIELEKNRIFSDEDLAFLVRKSATTNLKADFDHRVFNHKMRRTASDRTSSGRVVIRSWKPTVIDSSSYTGDEDHGWKHVDPPAAVPDVIPASFPAREERVARLTVSEIRSNMRAARGRSSKLKRMQCRPMVLTILANLFFVPKQVLCSLMSRVTSTVGNRAC